MPVDSRSDSTMESEEAESTDEEMADRIREGLEEVRDGEAASKEDVRDAFRSE